MYQVLHETQNKITVPGAESFQYHLLPVLRINLISENL